MRQVLVNYTYIWACAMALHTVENRGKLLKAAEDVTPVVAVGLLLTVVVLLIYRMIDRK